MASGTSPARTIPVPRLDATTFTYNEVSYTIGGIVNDLDDGEVALLLSPLPDADTARPLTFRVGDTVLPFAEGTRSETDGGYSWTDSTEFGAEASPFADNASIELAIAKDALPGAPHIHLALGSFGDRITLVWTAPTHEGARSVEGYKVEVSEDSSDTWSVLAENEPVDPLPSQRPAGRYHLRLPRVVFQFDRNRGAIGRRQRVEWPGESAQESDRSFGHC